MVSILECVTHCNPFFYFTKSFTADLEGRVVERDGKAVVEDPVEMTVYYDRKRFAERIDVHTYRTSYLFMYGQVSLT